MSKALVLDKSFDKKSELALPADLSEINGHNLYLYVKSYMAGTRANNAKAQRRGEVRGGGKKPWAQKGGGRGRAGSLNAPTFVGGGVSHGPLNNKNYDQKINKKQKKLALKFAINQKGVESKLFVVDKIAIESGKTKDAAAIAKKLGGRTTLFVAQEVDEKTFMAFRNLPNCYLAEQNELNGYMAVAFGALVIEQSVFDSIIN